jgi:hypothetical protein
MNQITTHTWKIAFRLLIHPSSCVAEEVYIDAPTAADALTMLDVLHPAKGRGDRFPRTVASQIEWVPPGSTSHAMPRLK